MTRVSHTSGDAVEVYLEPVAAGGVVTARIVLQGNSFVAEVARLRLSQAHWEDFAKCLGNPSRVKQGKIVFAPAAKQGRPFDRASEPAHAAEAAP
jgi:hypothetical protein